MKKIAILAFTCLVLSAYHHSDAQIKPNNVSAHKPYYNPGGDKFAEDKEFANSYNKKNNINDGQTKVNSASLNSPPGTLIASHVPAKFSKKDLENKNFKCVNNEDIPDEMKPFIMSKCIEKAKIIANENSTNSRNFIKANHVKSSPPKIYNAASKKPASNTHCNVKIKNKRSKINRGVEDLGEIKFNS